eukprot:Protomagalhaensia_sp_Gyna_25__1714@NODE_1897_length_1435_cov_45_189828_g1560_i0_p3_GENE_NODE_1897_length_1435_cov_45_189828_g1560_i0NODE_1897_length_1435_cov_45_189828_g1560_i0_p3_ORF_typecomplete_len147_score15_52DUF5617/PF18493_1/0_14_NODE_1897_length_1435_cov_45_189828_g1560_i09251365
MYQVPGLYFGSTLNLFFLGGGSNMSNTLDALVLKKALLSHDDLLLDQLLNEDLYDSTGINSMLKGLTVQEGNELAEVLAHKILRDYSRAPHLSQWVRAVLLHFGRDQHFVQLAQPTLQALRAIGDSKRLMFPATVKCVSLNDSALF